MKFQACVYCSTNNPASAETCLACGAPLERPLALAQAENTFAETPIAPAYLPPAQDESLLRAAQTVEKLYTGALTAYAILWRTLAELVAIGLVAFTLGLVGGALEMGAAAVFCATLLGVAVELVNKPWWWAAVGAPLGALAGSLVYLPAWILDAGPGGVLFAAFVGAVIGAVVGHRPARKSWWDWLRPFLGAAAGMVIALLGLALGAGLRWLFQAATGG